MTKLLPPEDVTALSVTEVTSQVRTLLDKNFRSVWVAGEISNLKRHQASGHIYLSLKDSAAVLGAVIWRSVAARFRFDPRDGMEVLACGRITLYPPQGKCQLEIEALHPKGMGALDLALRQLKEKLLVRGYFDPKRKKPLPKYPLRIALVTSPTGAAVRDMLEILTSRWPVAELIVCPVRVQGDGAAGEIAAAIALLNRLHHAGRLLLDAMIVGRGGGSLEDLWAFNEEIVAEAIFASKVPVVSAVGHEIDVTIADLVADYRAATPSHAAADLTPDHAQELMALLKLRGRLDDAVRHRIAVVRERLDGLAGRPALRRPLERVREQERRLDDLTARMQRAVDLKSARAAERLSALAGRLESLSPLNVLRRGYSLTRTEDQPGLVRDAAQLQVGERLRTTLARGQVISRIEEVRPGEP
jgi:exodeoxyribonuclease VII large subunit